MSDIIWKPVKGFEGLYDVSNTGEVRSYYHPRSGKLGLYPYPKKLTTKMHQGRPSCVLVHLTKDKQEHNVSVARLVAEAFLPNIEKHLYVCHLDGNVLNNHVYNLVWVRSRKYAGPRQ